MSLYVDILGKRFGKLVAIEQGSNGPLGKWVFRCDCGTTKNISKQNVMQGKVKSCGCLQGKVEQVVDLVGQRFGSLTVIRLYARGGGTQTKWLVVCDCGKEKSISAGNLKSKHTTSCGCLRIFRHPAGDVGFQHLYARYRHQARRHARDFLITKDEFRRITQLDCFYCGSKPAATIRSKSDHSSYVYNGLDRVDSALGYALANVVPCCAMCNRMKLDHSSDAFKAHVRKICAHFDAPRSA